MQLNVALLYSQADVFTAVRISTFITAKLLAATTDGRGFDYPFAVKTDPGVLLNGRQLLLQRRVVHHQLDHV